MTLTPRSLRRAAGLALVAALGIAGPVTAQGRSPEETKTIDGYRLTMPVLRKVLPALYAPGASSCEQRKDRDPHTLSLAEMTRSLERCAPVMEALGRAGVRPREAALVFASLLRTGQQVAMKSGNARALPQGALRDNALLLEQNDPELRRLTNPGAQS
jgi:hypothetical protein